MRERESLTHGTPWVTCKLGDLCTVKTGKLNANAAVEGGEYPFFTCSKQDYRIDQYSFDGEALLISGNGDVGNVKYYNGKFDAYQRTYVLMGFKLDAKYLYYYLKESMPKRARDMLNGSAVPYIKLNCITDFEISYPEDIEEQKRIAKVLSDLDRLQELHGLKVQELCKMKDHLMDNKSGIIETERNRNAVDLRILELSNKLGMSFNNTSSSDIDTRIKLHKESLKNINYKIEVITYVGENEHYDRERESLTHGTPWVTSKLGDLCKMKSGGTPKSSVSEYYNGTIPFLTIRDMTNQGKHVKTTEKYITQDAVNSCSTWVVPSNTLIYSTYGSIGFVSYIDVPCAINQAVMALTDLKIDSAYLYHYLKTLKDTPYLESRIIGGAIRHINGNILKDFDISYPQDIEEQKRIAQVLSDLDELSRLHSLKVDELSKMKEHLMDNKSGIIENERNKQENNEWVTVKLKDVCDFTKGKNPQDYNEDGLGRPIVSAPEIESTLGNTTYAKFTDENLPDCVRDDILLLWDGSRAGVSGFNHEAILSSTIMRLRVKDKNSFYPKLIYYMLTVNKNKISSNRTGSAIPHLNRQVVEDLTFDLPRNIEEQKRIAKMLSEYDSMVASQEQLISIIQRERESLYVKLLRQSSES